MENISSALFKSRSVKMYYKLQCIELKHLGRDSRQTGIAAIAALSAVTRDGLSEAMMPVVR
jgi:hypothetical protein